MMEAIGQKELEHWLAAHSGWGTEKDVLRRDFTFRNFMVAFGFLAQVAMISEKQNHHAQIENMYNKVTLRLTTHDAGNRITARDIKFAEAVERIADGQAA